MTRRRRIAVITPEPITSVMAGPAIRAQHIAEELGREHDVVLLSTAATDDDELRRLVASREVLVVQGWVLARRPWLVESDAVIVVDVYDPLHLEQLEQGDRDDVWHATAVLNEQLMRADLVLCASEQQRLFWLGALGALGRLNPVSYAAGRTLRSLLAVVPFGVPDGPPVQEKSGIKGAMSGVGADDRVVLWGGGIYDWFDPLTLLRAMARLRDRVPNARLVFMGMRHPSPDQPEMPMAHAARELSDSLGLTGTHVFFNDGWVPYESRADFLLDADAGVSCHELQLETELSFRTRVLDYLWAGLPIVTSAGDAFAALVETRGLGCVVAPGDVDGLAAALEQVLTDDAFARRCRANALEVADEFRWSRVLRPLVEFCRDPVRAPDLMDDAQRRLLAAGPPVGVPATSGVRGAIARSRLHVRDGGFDLLVRRGIAAVGRRLRFRSGRAGDGRPPPPG